MDLILHLPEVDLFRLEKQADGKKSKVGCKTGFSVLEKTEEDGLREVWIRVLAILVSEQVQNTKL